MADVHIELGPGGRDAKILVDGHEMPDVVALSVGARVGEVTAVTLEIWAMDVTIDADAAIHLVTDLLDGSGMKAVPKEEAE